MFGILFKTSNRNLINLYGISQKLIFNYSNINKFAFSHNFLKYSTIINGIDFKSHVYTNFIPKHVNNKEYKYLFLQKKYFAGRQRGLKRRKSKKEPRRIQIALGRRLELFWPKKRRKVRIRLVQNSRGNLIYDPVLKKFLVFYYKQGTQVFRGFRARGAKYELGRSKALSFARQMADYYVRRYTNIKDKFNVGDSADNFKEPGATSNMYLNDDHIINYNLKLQPDCNLSGVRGIFFDNKTSSWVVKFNEFGVRKYKFFSTNEFGFQDSYKNAVDFLRFQLYKNHQFLHRRHRTRKNRPILK
uniref:AP2 domain containing protein, putative n=1 Tax=Theileria annulata TaxID=5874 RepID=A0A3B0MSD0_THEAN